MNTPIFDFVKNYKDSKPKRLHMPGHKGSPILGFEEYDITEIDGADNLYQADGIIAQSEKNATQLFECNTFYSTEGSSLCIWAMLYIAKINGVKNVLAGRNAHKTFITAAAFLDIDIEWLWGNSSYLSCNIDPKTLEEEIKIHTPDAVYITSPDYLGCISDINAISKLCKAHGIMLLVDCAHGSYLKFLPNSLYPTDLGADMCCSSAHKTLPCLTGGAYLHIKSDNLSEKAKNALSLFGSTSPSYLILQSLDKTNEFIFSDYKERLSDFILKVEHTKKSLRSHGYCLYEDEPLKITICTKSYGYTGTDFAKILRENSIECEFCDPDFTVLMLGIDTDLEYLKNTLFSIPIKPPITVFPPMISKPQKAIGIRQAILSKSHKTHIKNAQGKILASLNVSCPPAVPIAVCGEIINEQIIDCFEYYGINECEIVSE